jgi:hypothetical protein
MSRVLIIIVVLLAVIAAIWFVIRIGRDPGPEPVENPRHRYKSKVSPGSSVPLKVLVMMPDESVLFSEPKESAATSTRLGALTIWYPFEDKDGFTRIGKSPLSDATIGWVKSSEVTEWTTKEGIRPNEANRERPSFDFWNDRARAGSGTADFRENPDFEIVEPLPVLAAANGQYQVAILSQNEAADQLHVATPWSRKLRVPDDALFSYLTTREELDRDITDLTSAFYDLKSGGSGKHPVARFMKKFVDIVVDRDIVNANDDERWLRRILREMRGPESMSGLQEADLRRDAAKIEIRLRRMKEFYNTREVWNDRGQAWLPSELLPAN